LTWIKKVVRKAIKKVFRNLRKREEIKSRPIAVGFVLALASATQAMPLAPLQYSESLIIDVREDCGAGFTHMDGQYMRTPA
jgi:hypothetical protein